MISRRLIISFICLAGILLGYGTARPTEQTRSYLKAIEQYRQRNYAQAAASFLAIAGNGVQNGKLFYNLGNAYLREGRLGHAILWYERALLLIPDDPDLKFNHDYAVSLTKDRIETNSPSLWRILFFWNYLLSPEVIRWLAIILNLAFWSLLLMRTLLKKKPLKAPIFVLLLILLGLTATAATNYYYRSTNTAAIILADEAPVRSGLSDQATELFVLHAGTKVKVEREMNGFYRIHFTEGKIGWLPKASVEVIQG